MLVLVLPDTIAMSDSLLKITLINTSIFPIVLPIAIGNTIHILTHIDISIDEVLLSKTMFQTICKVTLIPIFGYIDPLTVREAT